MPDDRIERRSKSSTNDLGHTPRGLQSSAPVTEAQLKVLLAVADTGGFSLASERLAMSQPSVSRAVASLEEELGVQLLTAAAAPSRSPTWASTSPSTRAACSRTAEAIRQEAGQVPATTPGTCGSAACRASPRSCLADPRALPRAPSRR